MKNQAKSLLTLAFTFTSICLNSQIWVNPSNSTNNSDPTYRAGDVQIDGVFRINSNALKITNNQVCVETPNADLYLNNASGGSGKVWLGRPWTSTVSILSPTFHAHGEIHSNGIIVVGGATKITNNQICSEGSADFYVNNAALGTGNVWLGKPVTGTITAMHDFSVASQAYIGGKLKPISAHFNSGLLQVKGKGVFQEVVVTQSDWADFVFDKGYHLTPLADVEKFYKENHHLPFVPTTQEIIEKGNNLGATDAILLRKIEELTLYVVEQEKKIEKLSQELKALK